LRVPITKTTAFKVFCCENEIFWVDLDKSRVLEVPYPIVVVVKEVDAKPRIAKVWAIPYAFFLQCADLGVRSNENLDKPLALKTGLC
jgi:hypothetical protein